MHQAKQFPNAKAPKSRQDQRFDPGFEKQQRPHHRQARTEDEGKVVGVGHDGIHQKRMSSTNPTAATMKALASCMTCNCTRGNLVWNRRKNPGIDCDLCRTTAPATFQRNDEAGVTVVYRQPVTAEEIALAGEAMNGCPTDSIGCDGGGPAEIVNEAEATIG